MTRLGPQRGLAPESRTVLHASGQNSRVLFSLRHLRPDEVGPFLRCAESSTLNPSLRCTWVPEQSANRIAPIA